MSIALPTLLLVAALIPGIAFVSFFYAGKFPRQLTGLSPLSELALYFLWALPIDAIALRIVGDSLTRSTFNFMGQLLGFSSERVSPEAVYCFLRAGHWWNWTWTYVFVVVAAAIAGSTARRLVWALRLDVLVPLLRLKAEWFYVLLGRTTVRPREIIPQADVLVNHPDGSRLYAGVVSGFEASKDGGIEQLYLTGAQRYRRSKSRKKAQTIVDVPGDVLAIPGATIHSINMRYFIQRPPAGKVEQILWWAEKYMWAFLREA